MNRRNIAFAVMLVISGCDLFSPRKAEPPDARSSQFEPPVTPEIVLENLGNAVASSNVDNYLRCFVDSGNSGEPFAFVPSGNFQGAFQSWTLEEERRYFQNLGTPAYAAPVLSITNANSMNRTSFSAEYTMNYLLFYPHSRPNVSKQAQGYMHLYFSIDPQQRWAISRWEDNKTTTDSTWSYLKYNFIF